MGKAKTYQSSASLWVDNAAPAGGSSLSALNFVGQAPSSQEQSTLTELLATPGFLLAVANGSLLKPYMLAPHSDGWGPTALIKKLKGGNPGSDASLESSVAAGVTSRVPGPQVLQISYTGPTPIVAQSTLQAVVRELQTSAAKFGQLYGHSAVSYDRTQLQSASATLTQVRQEANRYLGQHPAAMTQNNPTYASLMAAETVAGTQVAQDEASLQSAVNQTQTGATGAKVRVIDQASLPIDPVSAGKKKVVEAVVGGAFAGLVITFLAILAMTPGGADEWELELAGAAGPARPTPVVLIDTSQTTSTVRSRQRLSGSSLMGSGQKVFAPSANTNPGGTDQSAEGDSPPSGSIETDERLAAADER
jgi:hypothetical protein